MVATHPDAPSVSCRKNVVGEYASQDADRLVGKILSEFGNVFNIHAHAFIIDANAAANSPSMKAFKAALSDFKTEIIDVSIHYKLTITDNVLTQYGNIISKLYFYLKRNTK